jgi:hypothetical protein
MKMRRMMMMMMMRRRRRRRRRRGEECTERERGIGREREREKEKEKERAEEHAPFFGVIIDGIKFATIGVGVVLRGRGSFVKRIFDGFSTIGVGVVVVVPRERGSFENIFNGHLGLGCVGGGRRQGVGTPAKIRVRRPPHGISLPWWFDVFHFSLSLSLF